jgi:hypothetical protein
VKKIQPIAIAQFYTKLWPGVKVIPIDSQVKNRLAQIIDIGGADKALRFPDGDLAFLAQRFRRYEEAQFDDFTLRRDRPSGIKTEFQKAKLAFERGGFLASYYAYGHVNEMEDGFIRMRVLKFREFLDAVLHGEFTLGIGHNPDGSSTFWKIPFRAIPPHFFLLNYASDKPQLKLKEVT